MDTHENSIEKQNMHDLISVIIPVHNIEEYLPYCIDSIVNQSYKNLEIILVDDGSTDNSPAICDDMAKHDSRIIVIHQQSKGAYGARNTGRRSAHGQYIMFVDGDDYMHCEAIAILHDTICHNGGQLAAMDYKKTEKNNEDVSFEVKGSTTIMTRDELIHNLFKGKVRLGYMVLWNKLFKRELIQDNWFDEYSGSEDFAFNFRTYLNIEKAYWVHCPLYYYVQRHGSIVHSNGAWDRYYWNMTHILYRNFQKLPPEKTEYSHYLLERLYSMMVCLKYWNQKTPRRKEAYYLCQEYERNTRHVFWKNHDISIGRKLFLTLQLRSPRFARYYLRLRNIIMKK